MLVVDASVLATALVDAGSDGRVARERLRGERLAAPEVLDLEVTSVLRRQVLARQLDSRVAATAVRNLVGMPIERVSHRRLVHRCWELHPDVTAYDAAYVALAEATDALLVTADARLARAPGPRCRVEVLAPG